MAHKFLGFRGKSLEWALNLTVILPCYILFGYNHAVAGGLLSLPSWTATFPEIDTIHTEGEAKLTNSGLQGTIMAIYTLGCFLGCINCIWLGDKLGRRGTIITGAIVNIVGAVLQCTAFSLPQLAIGRLVTGFGFGHITATAPNWQAECCRAENRGAVVMLEGVFISLGLALASWVNLAMERVPGSISWRLPLSVSVLWAMIVIVTTPFMPESPRWLIKKGRLDEARQVLAAFDGTEDKSSPELAAEIEGIHLSLAKAGEAKFRHVFHNGEQGMRLLHRTCLACAVQVFHQMCGVNALAFYQTKIFEDGIGLASTPARILAASVFTFQFLVSPVGAFTVDRFGRRKLMMFSAVGMGTCMAIMAGATSLPHTNIGATAAATMSIFMFSFFFPIGFLGLSFLYAAEMAPLSHRVPITALSTGTAWLFNFVVAEVTPVGFATIKYRYFIIYAAMNFCMILPAVYLFFPETNGRRLEELDEIFHSTESVFRTVKDAHIIHQRNASGPSSSEEVGRICKEKCESAGTDN
ncbi:putative MFS sugar transporter [Apodospora peruviana]|uniref:MFS sugar transporter n=1 Tax=Apodospora peruviana TaxID=516989 RepID=A0AAE0MGB4_9PEZI|nr:putative MFS sugar transporter [Apodospora peruviana]